MFNFYLSIIKYENKSLISLKYYFSYNHFISKNITEIFFSDYYDFTNVFDNDRSAIVFKIDNVERNEPHG